MTTYAPLYRTMLARGCAAFLLFACILPAAAPKADAFSVLAHQGVVDQAWESTLVPIIRERFPNVTQADLDDARGYAHGGSHLPDLGYFPLGNREFTDLLHYVRTGDFASRLLSEASTPQEYAFALGELAHYEADSIGHPLATNLAIPILYPGLESRYGDSVNYAESPSAHLETEFRFDVLQVARRKEIPGLFQHAVDFKVPENFLNRVFEETYGFDLNDLFTNFDIALTTYRWGFRTLINEGTGIAWQLYRSDIDELEPGITSGQFVENISRTDFEEEFGKAFLEPGYFARFVGFLGNLLPNVGPLKRLPYKPLPATVRQLYIGGFNKASEHYREEVVKVAAGKAYLENLNLDTGGGTLPGQYEPADKVYVELLRQHARDHFNRMPRELADNILNHFRDRGAALKFIRSGEDREKTLIALGQLQSVRMAESQHARAGAH